MRQTYKMLTEECLTDLALVVDRLMSAFIRHIDADPFNSDSSLHCLAPSTTQHTSLINKQQSRLYMNCMRLVDNGTYYNVENVFQQHRDLLQKNYLKFKWLEWLQTAT